MARSQDTSAGDITIGDIPDAVFATDLTNRITHWADSAAALFGYSAAEAIGRPFGELLPFRIDREADEQKLLATIRAGRTWRGVGTIRLRDRSERWIESATKPRVVDGEVVGSVSVARDVTDVIEAGLRLAEGERFVNGILAVAGSLVLVLDASGTVVRFNVACEQLSGYLADEVVGRRIWDDLIPPEELAGVIAAFGELRAGAFPNHYENDWVRRDGARRLISWSNTCLTDDGGSVTHVIGTGVDITEQRRAEDALRGIAAVGQVLASEGTTDASLDAVLGILADQMGYRHLALLVAQGDVLRVAAFRGYDALPPRSSWTVASSGAPTGPARLPGSGTSAPTPTTAPRARRYGARSRPPSAPSAGSWAC